MKYVNEQWAIDSLTIQAISTETVEYQQFVFANKSEFEFSSKTF